MLMAHRDDGKRFVVHADEKLTAFLELEARIAHGRNPYIKSRSNADPESRIVTTASTIEVHARFRER
jgi:hypothetical protein